MCSKHFWEQHESFLATQNMISMMTTLLQITGIIPTKGTCRKCNDSSGGKVLFKCTSIHIYWTGTVTVSPKPTSVRTQCRKKPKPHFLEGCQGGVHLQRKKNHPHTPHDFSYHSTELTQEAWKPQFWPGISLSLVWLPHSTLVKAGQPVQKGLPLCKF